ncbi:MAG: hypothetical protein ACP5SI_08680 [Chloroflexia bacterium]
MKRSLYLLLACLMGLVACGTIPTPSPTEEPRATPVPPTPTPGWPAEAQKVVDQVIADAAARARVAPAEVEVVRVEAVDWPDSCLGCAGSSRVCLEVVTPGYRIVVRAAGHDYEYHTSRSDIVYCAPGASQDWGPAQPLVDRVVADLAARLGVPGNEIAVLKVQEVDWPDSSLGCPQPGYAYLQVITPGYQILLQAQGQTYDYHTDRGQTFVLCR